MDETIAMVERGHSKIKAAKMNLGDFALVVIPAAVLVLAAWTGRLLDWSSYIRPAALAVLYGHSPYTVPGYYNPPWIAILLAPVAALPPAVTDFIFPIFAVVIWVGVARRMGASPAAVAVLLLSPPLFVTVYNGQLEWMIALAVILPPRWGLFLALAKPQMGVGLALFWLVQAWHEGGYRSVIATFWPVVAAGVLSVFVFGMWFGRTADLASQAWNASLWPYAIPVGIYLLIVTIKRHSWESALAAGALLSPYVALCSYAGTLMALVTRTRWLTGAVAISWGILTILAIAR